MINPNALNGVVEDALLKLRSGSGSTLTKAVTQLNVDSKPIITTAFQKLTAKAPAQSAVPMQETITQTEMYPAPAQAGLSTTAKFVIGGVLLSALLGYAYKQYKEQNAKKS